MEQSIRSNCERFRQNLSAVLGLHCGFVFAEEVFSNSESGEPAGLHDLIAAKEDDHFCSNCRVEGCSRQLEYRYGVREAYRWDGRYTFYCPLGLVFTAASVEDEQGKLLGGFAIGPMVVGEGEDIEEVLVQVARSSAIGAATNLFITNPSHVQSMVEVLGAVTVAIMGYPHKKGPTLYRQKEILKNIYDAKEKYVQNEGDYTYFLEFEKKLQEAVYARDRNQLRTLYGQLLGHIGYFSAVDQESARARTLEIFVILSRAAIDVGADVQTIFHISNDFSQEFEKLATFEEQALWLTDTMERFISAIFDYSGAKYHDLVGQTMAYVKENYDKRITLDELAGKVYLSKSYLCSVFKEETGMSIIAYINRIRVQKSKQLLADSRLNMSMIASKCGFQDQSYFTKIFKRETGLSPKQYRESLRSGNDE